MHEYGLFKRRRLAIDMKYSDVELNDLPDEILLIILKKLDNLEVLYSFHGANERLNRILHDPIFTSCLNFVKWSSFEYIDKFSSNILLDRFCLQILPEICTKIKWLDLESSSMECLLHAADFSNLYGLGLYNINEETAECLFTGKKISTEV